MTLEQTIASHVLSENGVPYVDWGCLGKCGLTSSGCVLSSGCLFAGGPTDIVKCLASKCGANGGGCLLNCF